MRNVIGSVVLVSTLLFAGCSSTVEAACEKAKECNPENSGDVEKCVADYNKQIDTYKAQKNAACDKLADALEAVLDCQAGLSCEAQKDASNETVLKCASEFSKAVEENLDACAKK